MRLTRTHQSSRRRFILGDARAVGRREEPDGDLVAGLDHPIREPFGRATDRVRLGLYGECRNPSITPARARSPKWQRGGAAACTSVDTLIGRSRQKLRRCSRSGYWPLRPRASSRSAEMNPDDRGPGVGTTVVSSRPLYKRPRRACLRPAAHVEDDGEHRRSDRSGTPLFTASAVCDI